MNSNFENFENDNDDFDLEAALAASQFDEEDHFEELDEDHDFNAALKESTQAKAINDCQQVNTLPNNRQIEPAQLMNDVAAQSHTPALRLGFENLAREYPGFRGVRGDGNCYYRGVMYSLIEQLVSHPNRQALFADLAQRFRTLADRRVFNNRYIDQLNELVALLDNASQNQCWESIAALEADMRDPSSHSDQLLVNGARILLAYETHLYNLREPGYVAEEDINDTLTPGTCAQGVGVQEGLLPSALGISMNLERIETNANDAYSPLGTRSSLMSYPREDRQLGGPSSDSNPFIQVSLLLKPGHFDMIYGPEQFRAINMVAPPIPAPLNNDALPLQPSFFMEIMASPLSKIAATVMLLAGAALLYVTLPVINAITYIASACVVAGMGFFAKKALMDDNHEPINLNNNAATVV